MEKMKQIFKKRQPQENLVSIILPTDLLNEIDYHVQRLGYADRAALLRESLLLFDAVKYTLSNTGEVRIYEHGQFWKRYRINKDVSWNYRTVDIKKEPRKQFDAKYLNGQHKKITIDFSNKAIKQVDKMIETEGLSSRAELFSNSLSTYVHWCQLYADGGVVIMYVNGIGQDIASIISGLKSKKAQKPSAPVTNLNDYLKNKPIK